MYILCNDQTIEKYPYSVKELRDSNPNTSFPKNPSDELLATWNVYKVNPTSIPSFNRVTENIIEGTPSFHDGQWFQVWVVTNATVEEITARKAQQIEEINLQRSYLYREEADPLFFKYQRGEATEQEWLDKVDEIRARYPYPDEVDE
jgi:hypothetical protein